MQQNDTLEAIVKVRTNVSWTQHRICELTCAALTWLLPVFFHRMPTVIIQSSSSALYRQPGERHWTHSLTNRTFVITAAWHLFSLLFQKTALERQKPPHRWLDKVWYPAHFSQMPGEERQVRKGAGVANYSVISQSVDAYWSISDQIRSSLFSENLNLTMKNVYWTHFLTLK